MQFLGLIPWLMLAVYGSRTIRRRRETAIVLTLGLCMSMAGQLFLLWQDGLLNLSTGLPLHICGMMAVLSVWLVWAMPDWLFALSLYIGMPCALLALCFPAVVACSRPVLMTAHFNRLHGLILCSGVFVLVDKKTLPGSEGKAFLLGSIYMWVVWRINPLLGSNYLFLRAVPSGTPLVWLAQKGEMYILLSYEMLAMLMIFFLKRFWQAALDGITFAGNRKACSR